MLQKGTTDLTYKVKKQMQSVSVILLEVLVASGVLSIGTNYFFKWIKSHARDKFQNAFLDIAEIYETLLNLKSKSNCKRITLIKAENGGGVPSIDNSVFLTMLYEVFDHDQPPMRETVQKRLADKFNCISILSPLANLKGEGRISLQVSELEGQAKNVYEGLGYKTALGFRLGTNKKRMIYALFYFDKTELEISPLELEYLEGGVAKLQRNFS